MMYRTNRIGPCMRFYNFRYAVRGEQSLPRISSSEIYKDFTALHNPLREASVTNTPGDTGIRLRIIALYERIRRHGSECGNPSKAHDIEGKQKGEKSSLKRKSSKSWTWKQNVESEAFNKALEKGRLSERYRLRAEWMTAWELNKQKERICDTSLWEEKGLPIILWHREPGLDERMYHDESGRIRFFGQDGQVFFQEEWAKTGGSCPSYLWYFSELEQLSGGTMETTRRETK